MDFHVLPCPSLPPRPCGPAVRQWVEGGAPSLPFLPDSAEPHRMSRERKQSQHRPAGLCPEKVERLARLEHMFSLSLVKKSASEASR